MSKPSRPTRSNDMPSRRANPRLPAWNANSMRCARNWLTWPLILLYDRVLRLVSRGALALASGALRQLNKLRTDRCGAL